MTKLIAELRACPCTDRIDTAALMESAADEIERLRAVLSEIIRQDVAGGPCRKTAVEALTDQTVEN